MYTGEHEELDEESLVDRVGLVRGILVIITAIAVGSFVVLRGMDDATVGVEVAAPGPDPASTTTVPASTVPAAPTTTVPVLAEATTTTVPGEADAGTSSPPSSVGILIGPGDVSVLVLNAAGTKGVAGRGVEALSEAGYDTLAPRNATAMGPSRILFADGFEVVAGDVAEVFDLDATGIVAALDPATVPIDDLHGAEVVVIIGQDGRLAP